MAADLQVIECSFEDKKFLYLAFMPFVKEGGLFIRTTQEFELGDKVILSVKLPNDDEPYLVEGKVIWLTPKGALGNRPVGIGVQFTDDNGVALKNKIEVQLADMVKSSQTTDTI